MKSGAVKTYPDVRPSVSITVNVVGLNISEPKPKVNSVIVGITDHFSCFFRAVVQHEAVLETEIKVFYIFPFFDLCCISVLSICT
jgi:hypothetical protein